MLRRQQIWSEPIVPKIDSLPCTMQQYVWHSSLIILDCNETHVSHKPKLDRRITTVGSGPFFQPPSSFERHSEKGRG